MTVDAVDSADVIRSISYLREVDPVHYPRGSLSEFRNHSSIVSAGIDDAHPLRGLLADSGKWRRQLALSQNGSDTCDLDGRILDVVRDFKCLSAKPGQGSVDIYSGDRVLVLRSNRASHLFVRNLRTLCEGYVPVEYLRPDNSPHVSDEVWYHHNTSRKQAEQLLMSPALGRGAFLVRNCETCPTKGVYSLSVKDFDPVKGNHIKHYKLRPNGSNGYFIDSKNVFPSVVCLIRHYTAHCDGLCCRLSIHCPRHEVDLSVIDTMTTNTVETDIWNVPRDAFKFIRKLGQGMFGEVWQGRWEDQGRVTTVAIKTLKSGSMSTKAFLEEANIMTRLRHPKLVRLYAVCTDGNPLFIVTEYMANGSLLDYLRGPSVSRKARPRPHNAAKQPNQKSLLNIASQVASGMEYLEHHRYIHRDLAARNVLVDADLSVKIADFGLARFIEEDQYTAQAGARFPIKWTAPEAARYGTFSTKSDVWSFGVLLTELMTLGEAPYPGMSTSDVLDNIQNGYRMPRPQLCPELVYDVMLRCWDAFPERRPTFEFLHVFFDDFATTSQPQYHPV